MQFKNLDEKKDQTDLLFLTLLTNFPILKINWKRTADAQLISAAALILFSVSSGALFISIQLRRLVLYRDVSAGLEKILNIRFRKQKTSWAAVEIWLH